MFKWLKKYKVKMEPVIRCDNCFLRASMHMRIQFQRFGEEVSTEQIIIKMCDDCYEEVYERYNPNRLPAPIQAGVFGAE